MNLYDKSSLILVPSGVKASKVYSQRPENGDGDFTFSRASVANRINKNGLIEQVASNVPRLDYSDSSCPSLLLEPQRTNLVRYSEDFTQWVSLNSPIITPNYGISPDGTNNSTRIQFDFDDRIYTPVSLSGDITYSLYLKGSGVITIRENTNVYLQNITLTDQWIRYNLSFNSSITSVQIQNQGSESVDLEVWGVQVENGSYPTSYIPTYNSAVTRNVDTYNNTTGIAGLLGSTTGTFFVDMERFNTEDRDATGGTFELRSSNGQTELNIDIEASGTTRAFYRDGGSFNFMYQSSILRGKFCFIYNGSNLKLYHNGLNQFDYATALSANDFSQLVYTGIDGAKLHHQIMLFPTALTDEEAIALTTL